MLHQLAKRPPNARHAAAEAAFFLPIGAEIASRALPRSWRPVPADVPRMPQLYRRQVRPWSGNPEAC